MQLNRLNQVQIGTCDSQRTTSLQGRCTQFGDGGQIDGDSLFALQFRRGLCCIGQRNLTVCSFLGDSNGDGVTVVCDQICYGNTASKGHTPHEVQIITLDGQDVTYATRQVALSANVNLVDDNILTEGDG